MEEKSIINGKFSKSNIFVVISLVLSVIFLIVSISVYFDSGSTSWMGGYIPYSDYIISPLDCPEGIGVCFYLAIIFVLAAIFFVVEMNFCDLSITDKRVCGKTAFGKRVDLPLDMISSVGTCVPNGIVVATSSGAIKFWLLTNRDEVYRAISDLVKRRQNVSGENETNSLDEIKKLKELLDNGIITQEEFDTKKKQLLGL